MFSNLSCMPACILKTSDLMMANPIPSHGYGEWTRDGASVLSHLVCVLCGAQALHKVHVTCGLRPTVLDTFGRVWLSDVWWATGRSWACFDSGSRIIGAADCELGLA